MFAVAPPHSRSALLISSSGEESSWQSSLTLTRAVGVCDHNVGSRFGVQGGLKARLGILEEAIKSRLLAYTGQELQIGVINVEVVLSFTALIRRKVLCTAYFLPNTWANTRRVRL